MTYRYSNRLFAANNSIFPTTNYLTMKYLKKFR